MPSDKAYAKEASLKEIGHPAQPDKSHLENRYPRPAGILREDVLGWRLGSALRLLQEAEQEGRTKFPKFSKLPNEDKMEEPLGHSLVIWKFGLFPSIARRFMANFDTSGRPFPSLGQTQE